MTAAEIHNAAVLAHIAAVVTAASIVNPQGEPFDGDFAEALAAMVRWAETERCDDPVAWRGRLAKRLVNGVPDRVAEVCAGALVEVAQSGDDVYVPAIDDDGHTGLIRGWAGALTAWTLRPGESEPVDWEPLYRKAVPATESEA